MCKWVVYIVETKDNTLYCGITNNLEKRISAHNSGKGAKYTKPEYRRPVKLVYSAEYSDRSSASKEEWRIKQLSRKDKLKLIEIAMIRKRVYKVLKNSLYGKVTGNFYNRRDIRIKTINKLIK